MILPGRSPCEFVIARNPSFQYQGRAVDVREIGASNAGDPGMTLRYQVSEAAAQTVGIKVEALGVRSIEDFEPALTADEAEHAGRDISCRRPPDRNEPWTHF